MFLTIMSLKMVLPHVTTQNLKHLSVGISSEHVARTNRFSNTVFRSVVKLKVSATLFSETTILKNNLSEPNNVKTVGTATCSLRLFGETTVFHSYKNYVAGIIGLQHFQT